MAEKLVRLRMPVIGSGTWDDPHRPKYDKETANPKRHEHYYYDSSGKPLYVEVSVPSKIAKELLKKEDVEEVKSP